MKKLFLFVSLTSLLACQQPVKKEKAEGKAQPDSDILISCEGIGKVKLSDSYSDLEKKFGSKAISVHDNSASGKFISIWEGKPEQLNVYFKEKEAPFSRIRYIETAASDAPYMTGDSLRVGLSMRDVVRRNGFMPLTFNNFYNQTESGLITNFNNGDLPKSNPCFAGKLEWVSQSNIYKKDYDEFRKKQVVMSSDNVFNRMEVMLGSMRVSAKP